MDVLVLRPDHIGDMLLTTPFLTAFRASFPERRITVLCGSWSRQVLVNNPHVDEVVVCDFPWLARGTRAPWKSFFSTVRTLRARRFGIVVNLRKAARTAAAARAIGGKRRWGFDVGKSSWAHTDTIRYRTDIHIADLYVAFVRALGGGTDHRGLELYITEDERAAVDRIAALPERFAVLAPGAGYPEKYWSDENWAALAEWIRGELSLPVVFTGSAGESAMMQRIIQRMRGRAVDLSGKLTLRQTAVVIQKALFAVAVDSAAMHMASAMKTPVAALFGPTNPVHWGPYPNGRANRVVSKITEFRRGRGSTNRSGGMELITVEDVRSAVQSLCAEEQIVI